MKWKKKKSFSTSVADKLSVLSIPSRILAACKPPQPNRAKWDHLGEIKRQNYRLYLRSLSLFLQAAVSWWSIRTQTDHNSFGDPHIPATSFELPEWNISFFGTVQNIGCWSHYQWSVVYSAMIQAFALTFSGIETEGRGQAGKPLMPLAEPSVLCVQ